LVVALVSNVHCAAHEMMCQVLALVLHIVVLALE
jgi:hypothetical protein